MIPRIWRFHTSSPRYVAEPTSLFDAENQINGLRYVSRSPVFGKNRGVRNQKCSLHGDRPAYLPRSNMPANNAGSADKGAPHGIKKHSRNPREQDGKQLGVVKKNAGLDGDAWSDQPPDFVDTHAEWRSESSGIFTGLLGRRPHAGENSDQRGARSSPAAIVAALAVRSCSRNSRTRSPMAYFSASRPSPVTAEMA